MTPTLAIAFPEEAALALGGLLLTSAKSFALPMLAVVLLAGVAVLFRPLLLGAVRALLLLARPTRRKARAAAAELPQSD